MNGTASFGVTANGCAFPEFNGQFQYVDHDNDVRLHGEVIYARQCIVAADCPECDALRISLGYPFTLGDYQVVASYRSTNPDSPGDGNALVCFTDNGEGVNSTGSDNGIISLLDGPPEYAAYLNHGPIRGNIQQHECNRGQSQ